MITVIAIFVALVIAGRMKEELDWSHVIFCVVLMFVADFLREYFGLSPYLQIAVVAVINIGLVFKVFKGNLNIL
jgi:hypothetical protein